MSYDLRYNDFHLIEHHNWSTDLSQFPGIPHAFEWEYRLINHGDLLVNSMRTKWHYSFYFSAVYLVVIFSIQKIMNRYEKGFNLRPLLTAWNMFLAIFSIMGVTRCLPEFIHVLVHQGVEASFSKSTYYYDFRLNIWYLCFTLSKVFELFDTLFIVLRKQKLINLHWVHHVLTLTYSWYVFSDVPATARWMVNMNFLIHSMMYTYYALKAMRFTIPRVVNITITSLQIAQMFAGLFINYLALYYKLSGIPCDLSPKVAIFGFSLYFLFFLLFMNFFIQRYVLKISHHKSGRKSALVCAKTDINQNSSYKNLNHTTNGYTNGINSANSKKSQ